MSGIMNTSKKICGANITCRCNHKSPVQVTADQSNQVTLDQSNHMTADQSNQVTADQSIQMTADQSNQYVTNYVQIQPIRLTKKEYIRSLFDDIIKSLPYVTDKMFDFLCNENIIDATKITFEIYQNVKKYKSLKMNNLINIGYLPKDDELIDIINNSVQKLDIDFKEKSLPQCPDLKKILNSQNVYDGLLELETLIYKFDEHYFANADFMKNIIRRIIDANINLVEIQKSHNISKVKGSLFNEPNDKHVRIMTLLLNKIKEFA